MKYNSRIIFYLIFNFIFIFRTINPTNMLKNIKPIVAYVSLPEYDLAKKIGTILVEKRLVACAKIINNLESIYIWEDKLNTEKELYLMLKSSEEKVPEIKKILDEFHPYEVYEFIYFDIKGGNEKYIDWMHDTMNPIKKGDL